MLDQIPRNRLFAYVICIGLLPVLFCGLYVKGQTQKAKELRQDLAKLSQDALEWEGKIAANRRVISFYQGADHFYISKNLESLQFLQQEIEDIQALLSQSIPVDNETLKQRLAQLTGSANALTFTEGTVHSYPKFQELTETLVHPVEVSVDDLVKILSLIEGEAIQGNETPSDRPQLIITDFNLTRQRRPIGGEVYVLQLKVLKREFF